MVEDAAIECQALRRRRLSVQLADGDGRRREIPAGEMGFGEAIVAFDFAPVRAKSVSVSRPISDQLGLLDTITEHRQKSRS